MVNESPVATSISSSAAASNSRRVTPFEESAGLQRRSGVPRFPGGTNQSILRPEIRPRSSTFSEYSLKDARNTFQSSTEELLLPRLIAMRDHDSSPWHSAPLVFALLPALAGILFTNGSGIVTDFMLLGLAAIFLNWTVRLPWDWYHSAQATRQVDNLDHESVLFEGKENGTKPQHEMLEDEEVMNQEPESLHSQQSSQQQYASNQLRRHESIALISCFVLPLIGAYLLHSLRSQLNRPSDGLVSNYNLTIFLMASELRPIAHVIKLIQARTIHLQRIVTSKADGNDLAIELVKGLTQRLEDLEARCVIHEKSSASKVSDKQTNSVVIEVRKTIQSDIDALNRAVRRYEKRATLQTMQTESRLQEIESRLNDVVSLAAAAAANNERRRHLYSKAIIEGIAVTFTIPFRILSAIIGLPLGLILASIEMGKSWTSKTHNDTDKAPKPLNFRSFPTYRSKYWPLSQGKGRIKAYG
ncbi:hypothetical protein GcM1_194002 [Golovinomyces cichoracearum]|uniref:Uncharacterized protein n=1 Tax=Golovinomyces cichoracearum TaxID=62708 RepID=A0A420J0L3_9PEZI|nr:hypothetical protein GcM1_194002 [Golovinomyces cichoracearum]